MINALPFITGFALVAATMPLAIKGAVKKGFVDTPGGRKQHQRPVPPIGGLVIFPALFIGCFAIGVPIVHYWPLWAGVSLLLLVGALDDYKHIPPWPKFGAQFLAAFLIVLVGNARLYHLGNLFGFGDFGLGMVSIPFSVIATVLLINAINLMDGLDGLAGGLCFIIFGFFAFAASQSIRHTVPFDIITVLMGALAGFLLYNMRRPGRKKAIVFLGDSGSMALGLTIAWFAMTLAQGHKGDIEPIAVAWILALPIMDTCAQFYRRMKNGHHPFTPDRGHFHHHFIEAGLPVHKAVPAIYTLVFLGGIWGTVWTQNFTMTWVVTIIWILFLFTHIFLSFKTQTYINLLKKIFIK